MRKFARMNLGGVLGTAVAMTVGSRAELGGWLLFAIAVLAYPIGAFLSDLIQGKQPHKNISGWLKTLYVRLQKKRNPEIIHSYGYWWRKSADVLPFTELDFGIYYAPDPLDRQGRSVKRQGILVRNGENEQKIIHYWLEDEHGTIVDKHFESRQILPFILKSKERKELYFLAISNSHEFGELRRACVQIDNETGKVIKSALRKREF